MSDSEINTGKHCQRCFTVENKAVAHINHKFYKIRDS